MTLFDLERPAQHGAWVVISSRREAACAEVAAAFNAQYGAGRAMVVPASISSKADLEHLVAETMAQWGHIDVLVCNAASNMYHGRAAGIADEQFRKILNNNIVSKHWLISARVPQMIARRSGSVIIVSSIAGLWGNPVIGAYGISKAADLQRARNLAAEYGPHNICVSCIAPGLIRTDFARALWEA